MLRDHEKKSSGLQRLGAPSWGWEGLVSQATLTENEMMETGYRVGVGVRTTWLTGGEHSKQKECQGWSPMGEGEQCEVMKSEEARLVGFSKDQCIEFSFYFK